MNRIKDILKRWLHAYRVWRAWEITARVGGNIPMKTKSGKVYFHSTTYQNKLTGEIITEYHHRDGSR